MIRATDVESAANVGCAVPAAAAKAAALRSARSWSSMRLLSLLLGAATATVRAHRRSKDSGGREAFALCRSTPATRIQWLFPEILVAHTARAMPLMPRALILDTKTQQLVKQVVNGAAAVPGTGRSLAEKECTP